MEGHLVTKVSKNSSQVSTFKVTFLPHKNFTTWL